MGSKHILQLVTATIFLLLQTIVYGQEKSEMTMGNGENNSIALEDVKRDGPMLTFSNITIEGDGWVVIHPFEEGKPNGDKYVGATYLKSGDNKNVEVEVYKGLESGEMVIVMLHSDSNPNKFFDFVFVDEVNVMDKAVFEGNKMIAHAIAVP